MTYCLIEIDVGQLGSVTLYVTLSGQDASPNVPFGVSLY